MSTDLTYSKKSVAKGSVYDMAERRSQQIQDTLMDVDCIVALDISGSMYGEKHQQATEILRSIQEKYQGRVGLICFHSYADWEFSGVPPTPRGGTMGGKALDKMRDFTGLGIHMVLITDGGVQDLSHSIHAAAEFKEPIEGIFIGPDSDILGFDSLRQITEASGGSASRDMEMKKLEQKVVGLLTGGGN